MAILRRVGDHHQHDHRHHRRGDNTRLYRFALMAAWLAVIHHGNGVCVVMAAFENLPTSAHRQALVQKARELNPTFSSTSAATWSNRAGTVLTPICLDTSPNGVGGIYSADRPFLWNSIDVGGRMTVIALPPTSGNNNGNKPDLWVHSPVALDGPLRDAMAKIGTVKHVVSPNYEHVKYAPTWKQGYPQASMWACPGLSSRMENVKWKGEIPEGWRPPGWKKLNNNGSSNVRSLPEGIWDTSILQALHVDIEKNPFTGKPFFNEVIFYHVPTKSLLTTDIFWNYPSDSMPNTEHIGPDNNGNVWELAPAREMPLKSRAWKFGMDQVYAPFYNNFMVTDREAYRDICRHVLDEWQVECIIPCHGDIVRGPELCRSVLQKFFQIA